VSDKNKNGILRGDRPSHTPIIENTVFEELFSKRDRLSRPNHLRNDFSVISIPAQRRRVAKANLFAEDRYQHKYTKFI
jgi:hypothetical protein